MIGQDFVMPLKDCEKLEAVIEIGKLEHSEVKILYQVVIGAKQGAIFGHKIKNPHPMDWDNPCPA